MFIKQRFSNKGYNYYITVWRRNSEALPAGPNHPAQFPAITRSLKRRIRMINGSHIKKFGTGTGAHTVHTYIKQCMARLKVQYVLYNTV
jgi:hypothetical protein